MVGWRGWGMVGGLEGVGWRGWGMVGWRGWGMGYVEKVYRHIGVWIGKKVYR